MIPLKQKNLRYFDCFVQYDPVKTLEPPILYCIQKGSQDLNTEKRASVRSSTPWKLSNNT